MRLTLAASYALKAVVHIASIQQNKVGKKKDDGTSTIASHRIAAELKVPDRFLLKVLKPLVGAQILQSIKGPNGGYSLAKSPNEISMLEVIEAATQEKIRGNVPLGDEEPSSPLHVRLNQICVQVAEQTRKHLSKIRISDLAAKD
jgi:Rrf2 family protein